MTFFSPSRLLALSFLAAALYSNTALAQSNSDANARMDRLERNIMLLQRQLSRAENGSAASEEMVSEAPASAAQAEVGISRLEEQLRKLQGEIEQVSFQNKQISERLERMSKDVDFRFQELNKTNATAAASPAETTAETTDLKPQTGHDEADDTRETTTATPQKTSGDPDTLKVPAKSSGDGSEQTFASPREAYNYAFKLLRQSKHVEAGKAFDRFLKQYPKDPLAGNGWYWLGETHYVRRDYVKAADSFRQGFETMPSGPKAADNLLKLSMSLSALKEDKKACVVLNQLLKKFGANSASVKTKAEQEIERIGCAR